MCIGCFLCVFVCLGWGGGGGSSYIIVGEGVA